MAIEWQFESVREQLDRLEKSTILREADGASAWDHPVGFAATHPQAGNTAHSSGTPINDRIRAASDAE